MTMVRYEDLGHGITCIDTGYGRPGLAACYLIEAGNWAAFIDTGTYYTVPRLLEVLQSRGIGLESVAYVMPTHIHLDHGGGAGELMRQLPKAKLVIHPRGARHMIDPAKLTAGATAVYGEVAFRKNFGELVPIPAERVIKAADGFILDFNGRQLAFLDTPGHALHHYCVYDPTSKGFFTGDTFGLSYREFDTEKGPFIFATTTPVQFDPDAWLRTLERLLAYAPQRMYLTHFGCVENVPALADRLRQSIQSFADIALEAAAAGDDRYRRIRQRMLDQLLRELDEHGCDLSRASRESLLAMDIDLNAQGLEIWLARREKAATS